MYNNRDTYSYECPRCGNISVDFTSGDHMYCYCCDKLFSFQETQDIISKKMKPSDFLSTLGLVLFLLITLKFHLKYRFVIDGTKLVSYIGKNGEDEEIVQVPKYITEIGKYAFMNHQGIKQIILPRTIKKIGKCAFSNCQSLEKIFIPNRVKRIGAWSFWSCVNLTEINIPPRVVNIGMGAFCDNHKLKSVDIPSGVKIIDAYAFKRCVSLTSVTIPDGVQYIGKYAFEECGITEMSLPDSVTEICFGAFRNCKSLKSVRLPETSLSVSENDSNIKDTVGNSLFCGCESLDRIKIPHSIKIIPSSFCENCTSLKEVIVEGELSAIRSCAFRHCPSLERINLPDSVVSIGMSAFEGCYELDVTIPTNAEIHHNAFKDCTKLDFEKQS